MKIKTILQIITLIICISSCGFKNATYSKSSKWIPENFNPQKGILLIESHPFNEKQSIRMDDWLSKNYDYSYEVVSRENIESKNGNYSDTKKYPFAIQWESYTYASGPKVSDGGRSMLGHFFDRREGKVYPTAGKENAYGQVGYRPLFNTIVKHFK